MSEPIYIVGMHNYPGPDLMKGQGWVVMTEAIGRDSHDLTGPDYRFIQERVISRLNHGYGATGTIPLPQYYGDFARRCANFVAAAKNCEWWIIANEPNCSAERPDGQSIMPTDYARCFNLCQQAIHEAAPGNKVISAPIGPWNVETGDWLDYFTEVLNLTVPDGIALHTYTHGTAADLVFSEAKMQSHPDRYYHFRACMDFLDVVPEHLRHLPVFVTETDQDMPWLNANYGWVQNAYQEVNNWNQAEGSQKIWCLALYRWEFDKYAIKGKQGVIDDFLQAQAHGYTVPIDIEPEPPEPEPPTSHHLEVFYDGELVCDKWVGGEQQTSVWEPISRFPDDV